jgi:hypothetical protein
MIEVYMYCVNDDHVCLLYISLQKINVKTNNRLLCKIICPQIFQKSMTHLQTAGARKVT